MSWEDDGRMLAAGPDFGLAAGVGQVLELIGWEQKALTPRQPARGNPALPRHDTHGVRVTA